MRVFPNPSLEQRVMFGMFGSIPPEDVQEDMVRALQGLCLAAAKAVYEERYVGPTEEQLDAVAEEASKRISVSALKRMQDQVDNLQTQLDQQKKIIDALTNQ